MGIGDILDTTFRLYRQRFLTFLLIALVVYVPYALFLTVFQPAVIAPQPVVSAPGENPFDFEGQRAMARRGQSPVVPNVAGLIFWLVGILVFALVLIPLCSAAMIQNISASFLGENLTAGASYSRAAPRLLSLLGTQILVGLAVMVGFLLLIIPGVIFSLWFLIIAPVVVLEGVGGTSAMGRSRELMRGNLGKGFSLMFVVGILCAILGAILGAIIGQIPWPHPSLAAFVQTVVPVLWLPIQTAPLILLYYDLRIRKEAFDLQKLAEALGQPAPPSAQHVI
jgi:MFS family permease